jgi:tRNA (guanine37-N1)-methyltransferase
MIVHVFSALPEVLASPLGSGVLKRARESGALEVTVHDLHELSPDPHHKVDDAPFGGGPGMVLRVDVMAHALQTVFGCDPTELRDQIPVILMTPQGERFDQGAARDLAGEETLVFVCGRYEGIDERVREHITGRELSLGDFVLAGGELAAAAVLEAIVRLLPGVLGNEESLNEESFESPMLEYPQYTRPASFRGWDVPEVLTSGDHGRISQWRKEQALKRTRERRPDLL